MNVLDLLKQDHQMVAGLLDRVEHAEPGDAELQDLAGEIAQALTVHAALEESLFYPVLRDRANEDEERVDVFEAFTEHDVVKHLISLIKGRRKDDALFKAELQVLGENVKHHVKEEESTIFALARELMDERELNRIGERAESEKQRMMRSGRAAGGRKKTSSARKSTAKKSSAKKSSAKKSSAKKSSTRKGGGRKSR